MKSKIRVENLRDIEAYEKVPIEARLTFRNTYDLIKEGAGINPEAPAISFFPSGAGYASPQRVTYRELLAKVTQTANLLYDFGVKPGDVVSYLLPNLPQTHYILWGGQAAGIVNPINPLLEPATIRDICLAAGTRVLFALGPFPGSDIWDKAMAVRKDLPDLKAGEVPVAYVQLQEGVDLSGEKILEYLKKEVGERAAIPKEVIVIDQMPLTPVGKIF